MIRAVVLVALSTGAAAAACTIDDGGPRLDSVSPASAAQGATVALSGSRLCGGDPCAAAPATIALGIDPPMVEAQVVSYADTSASFIVPTIVSVGATAIVVTVGDQASNALQFQVLPP